MARKQRTVLTVNTPNNWWLSVRKEPKANAEVLYVLPYGAQVEVIKESGVPEGWCAVSSGGYIVRKFLEEVKKDVYD